MRLRLFVLSIFCLVTREALCQQLHWEVHWEATDGPWHGIQSCVAGHDSVLIAAFQDAESFQSTDFGEHWTAFDSNQGGFEAWWDCLEEHNGIFYSDYGRSTDEGHSWAGNGGHAFAFTSSHAYRGVESQSGSVSVTTDNGLTWSSLDTGLPKTKYVVRIAAQDSIVLVGVDSSLYISTEYGQNWRLIANYPNYISAVSLSGDFALAAVYGKSILFSRDRGANWTQLDSTRALLDVARFCASKDTVFAATFHHGIMRSDNGGISWRGINYGIDWPGFADIKRNGHKLWAAGDNGLYYSSNDGDVWVPMNRGMRRSSIINLVEQRGTILTSTPFVYRSSDHGNTWMHSVGDTLWGSVQLVANDSFCFVASAKGVFRTNDGGVTWTKLSPFNGIFSGIAVRKNTIYYQLSSGLYRSRNNGIAWEQIDSTKRSITALAASRSSLFAASDRTVMRSTDEGRTWNATSALIHDVGYTVSSFETHGDTILASGGQYSFDDGLTWGAFDCYGSSGYYTYQNGILYTGLGGGTATSTDWGANWEYPNPDSAFYFTVYQVPMVQQILVTNDYLYAGTDMGVWRAQPPLLGVKSSATRSISISNHPNPFATSTSFHINVASATSISLLVFDATGREVWRIPSGIMNAGEHDITFKRGDLPAGVYFYRLSTGSESQTGSMVIE